MAFQQKKFYHFKTQQSLKNAPFLNNPRNISSRNSGQHIPSIGELSRISSPTGLSSMKAPPLQQTNLDHQQQPTFSIHSRTFRNPAAHHPMDRSNISSEAGFNELNKIQFLQNRNSFKPTTVLKPLSKKGNELSGRLENSVKVAPPKELSLKRAPLFKPDDVDNDVDFIHSSSTEAWDNDLIDLGYLPRKKSSKSLPQYTMQHKIELNSIKPSELFSSQENFVDNLSNADSQLNDELSDDISTTPNSIILNDFSMLSEEAEKLKIKEESIDQSDFQNKFQTENDSIENFIEMTKQNKNQNNSREPDIDFLNNLKSKVDKSVVDMERENFQKYIEKHKTEMEQTKNEMESQLLSCQSALEKIKNEQDQKLKDLKEKLETKYDQNEKEAFEKLHSQFQETEKRFLSELEKKINLLKLNTENVMNEFKENQKSITSELVQSIGKQGSHSKKTVLRQTNSNNKFDLILPKKIDSCFDEFETKKLQDDKPKYEEMFEKNKFKNLSRIQYEIDRLKKHQKKLDFRISLLQADAWSFSKHNPCCLDHNYFNICGNRSFKDSINLSPFPRLELYDVKTPRKTSAKIWEEEEWSLKQAKQFLRSQQEFLSGRNLSGSTRHRMVTAALNDPTGILLNELINRNLEKSSANDIIKCDLSSKKQKPLNCSRSASALVKPEQLLKLKPTSNQPNYDAMIEELRSVDDKLNLILSTNNFNKRDHSWLPPQSPSHCIHEIICGEVEKKLLNNWWKASTKLTSNISRTYVSARDLIKFRTRSLPYNSHAVFLPSKRPNIISSSLCKDSQNILKDSLSLCKELPNS